MKTIQYMVPVDGTNYEQVNIEVEASSVIEATDRKFVNAADKAFLDDKANVVKKADVKNNLTSTNVDLPLSAAMGKALNDKFGGTKIVIGTAAQKPAPEAGVTILFIEIE